MEDGHRDGHRDGHGHGDGHRDGQLRQTRVCLKTKSRGMWPSYQCARCFVCFAPFLEKNTRPFCTRRPAILAFFRGPEWPSCVGVLQF